MPKKPQQPVSASAFLRMARDYADAANELFMVADARPKISGHSMPLSSPLYFLYCHAAESAFKAFLTAHSVPMSEITSREIGHNLPKLYERSRSLGLVIGPEDRFEIGNVVPLLHSENENQGFRYFNLGVPPPPALVPPGSIPLPSVTILDLSWVREAIPELIRAVEPHVRDNPGTGVAKGIFTFSRPSQRPRRSPAVHNSAWMRERRQRGGRVGAAWLVTGPILNARVRPRRVPLLVPEARE